MTVEENTHQSKLKLSSHLLKFESEIRRFDTILDLIQKHISDDLKIWDLSEELRDKLHQLQGRLHGVDVEIFAVPWLDPTDNEEEEAKSLKEDHKF